MPGWARLEPVKTTDQSTDQLCQTQPNPGHGAAQVLQPPVPLHQRDAAGGVDRPGGLVDWLVGGWSSTVGWLVVHQPIHHGWLAGQLLTPLNNGD
jgi:hypothetical protein